MRRGRARRDSACQGHLPRKTEAAHPCDTHASCHGTSNTDAGSMQVSMHAGVHTRTHTHNPNARQTSALPSCPPLPQPPPSQHTPHLPRPESAPQEMEHRR